jgi:MFS family permease
MIGGLYFIYWFQDVVGNQGFYLFGHHIADAGIKGSQVALAVSQLPNQVIGFIITLPAGWISDRFASERCLISCVTSVITTIFPLINAFYPSYTAVICASIAGSVIGGLTGPASGALRADIVPVDPATGKSNNPARDYLILSYASELPRLIIPIMMALVFMLFDDYRQAYFWFFIISAAIHFGRYKY